MVSVRPADASAHHAADRTDAAAMRSCEAWAFTDYRRLDQAYTGLVVGVDIDEL